MSERWFCSFSFLKSIFNDAWFIICEIIIVLFPRKENYIRSASCHNILYVMSIKSNIMLHLCFVMCKSRCHNWLDPFFIIYIPNRNRLRNTVWQCHNIVWIWRDVKIDHTVFMRREIRPSRRTPNRIPNNQHWILPWVSSHNQIFVLAARSRCYSIAMALQKFLLFRFVVIDDSCMCWGVEDFSSVFSC